jgi:hypothetical protein
MAIGFSGGGSGGYTPPIFSRAEQDWRERLRRLQEQQRRLAQANQGNYALSTGVAPVGAITGGYTSQGSVPGVPKPYVPGQTVAPTGTTSTASTGGNTPAQATAITTPSATKPKAKDTGKGGTPDNEIDVVTRPGRFYSKYPGSSIGAVAADVPQSSRAWAQFYGQGGDAYGNYLAQLYSDPRNMMLGMGVGAGKMNDPQDYLDWQGKMLDLVSGRTKVDGNYGYLTGKDIVKNVLGATKDKTAGSLGMLLNDPKTLPDEQVRRTIGMLTASLQSIISPDALNAYVAMIGQIGQDFIDQRMQNPKAMSGKTFNQVLLEQLGPGGGLY